MAAVLASIAAKGEKGVTAGLKKVTPDMKSKNNAAPPAPVPARAPAATPSTTTKPPRLECEQGRKWVVENYECPPEPLRVDGASARQAVRVSACADATVTVPAKVNAVSIDSCARVGVVVADVVATLECVRCTKTAVQVDGIAPSIVVEHCQGITLHLSPAAAAAATITTAQSSEINIVLMTGDINSDADPIELAVPEQFVTRIVDGRRLVTEPACHSGN